MPQKAYVALAPPSKKMWFWASSCYQLRWYDNGSDSKILDETINFPLNCYKKQVFHIFTSLRWSFDNFEKIERYVATLFLQHEHHLQDS